MIDFKADCKLKNITHPTLGAGENAIQSLMLILTTEVDSIVAGRALGNEKASVLLKKLFWSNDGQDRLPFIKEISSTYVVHGVEAAFTCIPEELIKNPEDIVSDDVRYSTRKITPKQAQDRYLLEFGLLIKEADKNLTYYVNNSVRKELTVAVSGGTVEMDFSNDDSEGAADLLDDDGEGLSENDSGLFDGGESGNNVVNLLDESST